MRVAALCHATPRNDFEIVTPATPEEGLCVDIELRRTPFDPAAFGGYEYPQASRAEATAYFESIAGG